MTWLLKRILAGLAAILVVAVGAGVLLGTQYSGTPAPWAASQGSNAAWLSGAWVNGEKDVDDFTDLVRRVEQGELTELYVHVADIDSEGGSDSAGYDSAGTFLDWAENELPDVTVLGWMEHSTEGSSLAEGRFDEDARAEIAATAGEVTDAGFAGVHLAISPVTTNDSTLPELLDQTREEIGPDAVLSAQAQSIEPVAGVRLPMFAYSREERYWSKGYLRRVADRVDSIVIQGHGTGMPMESLYGGFMVRQVEESLSALEPLSENGAEGSGGDAAGGSEESPGADSGDGQSNEDGGSGEGGSGAGGPSVRFGIPAYESETWGSTSSAENVDTATEAVRLGLTEHGQRDDVGLAVYVLDDTSGDDWAAYTDGWVRPER
ncbi:hypothetical protein F4561_001123 [Lipingzhangella halophila]|uniref:Uncharacterized protein n=1 Tax=Lipingzhangella halophila TaxID=1783352 RepID=A0A7W7RE45_9ACTN|nr:hypothetical protein [Lipingzhangella halophila]MBB4930303.1 hypothetical protein [Lipingzhangella halophila]